MATHPSPFPSPSLLGPQPVSSRCQPSRRLQRCGRPGCITADSGSHLIPPPFSAAPPPPRFVLGVILYGLYARLSFRPMYEVFASTARRAYLGAR